MLCFQFNQLYPQLPTPYSLLLTPYSLLLTMTLSNTTHAIQFDQNGGPEVLQWREVAIGMPGAGEVRIKHHAVGLNFIDIYFRAGVYPAPALPSGIGFEAAGVVEAVGDGVTVVAVGDRVAYGQGPLGAYSESRVMPVAQVVKLPDAVSFEQGAAMMLKGMTVEYLFNRTYPVKAGDTICSGR
jgi:NADPH:quinone reductase